ncbi:MAG: penicillin acylase family protein, partial [Gemmatimonadota bacterium]
MKTFLRVGAIGLVALALLVAAAWIGGRRYLARSVAPLAGEVIVAGPVAPIEILVDARGVPQVWARTDADARFALGWLHAAERLFQMELTRRMARGELAELFGEQAASLDAEQRRLGFACAIQALIPATYCAICARASAGIVAESRATC